MGTKIKDAQLLESVTGAERIPVSDGSGNPKAVTTEALKNFVGAGSSGGGGGMIEITYAELKSLRDNGKLVPGCKYRMIDYETTTSQEGTQAAGHPFDLILTALDEKTLDEKCSAIQSARDVDRYFANNNLGAWEVWYCLDNDLNRFRWAVCEGITIGNGEAFFNCQDYGLFNYKSVDYYAYRFDIGAIYGTVHAVWCYILFNNSDINVGDTPIYAIVNTKDIADSDEGYFQEMSEVAQLPVIKITKDNGKGVIYRLIDENLNDICYDFKNILFEVTGDNGVTFTKYTIPNSNHDGSLVVGLVSCKNNVILPNQFNTIPIIVLNHENTGQYYVRSGNKFINCTKVWIYVSDGGNYNNNVFENCNLSDFGSQGSNYYITIENCTIKNCSGSVFFSKTKNQFINCNIADIKDTTIEGSTGIEQKALNIRQKTTGEIFSYTDEDIYNAIQATKSES